MVKKKSIEERLTELESAVNTLLKLVGQIESLDELIETEAKAVVGKLLEERTLIKYIV